MLIQSINDISEAREALHESHASSRPLSEGYERVGLMGEAEFALRYGLKFDREARPAGDKGVDFHVPVSMTLDVKTARKPFNLIVEQGKVFADIYVLAGIDEFDRVTFYGWQFGSLVKKAPIKDFGYGVMNHYIPRESLRAMEELERRIATIKCNVVEASEAKPNKLVGFSQTAVKSFV